MHVCLKRKAEYMLINRDQCIKYGYNAEARSDPKSNNYRKESSSL